MHTSDVELHSLDPQGPAVIELVCLAKREEELRAQVDDVGRQARAATAELAEAREALAEMERHIAAGEVDAQSRTKAERRLARAEQTASVPWPQRRAGAERATQDARHALQLHIAEHFSEIVEELQENGRTAAAQVDHAAEAFVPACDARAEADQILTSVVALARHMRPNDVARTKTDAARREGIALIEGGGERAPELRIAEPLSA